MLAKKRCCCGGATCRVCFQTSSCVTSPPRSYGGIPVRVYSAQGGTLLASGTTASNGRVCFDALSITSNGNYWVEADAPTTRFADFRQSLMVPCDGTVDVRFQMASGYMCPCDVANVLGIGSGSVCPDPLPTTLSFSDGQGTVALTTHTDFAANSVWAYAAVFASTGLTGCAMRTAHNVWSVTKAGCADINAAEAHGDIQIPIVFALGCYETNNAATTYQVIGFTPVCCHGSDPRVNNRYFSDLTCDDMKTWPSANVAGFGPSSSTITGGAVSCGPFLNTLNWDGGSRPPYDWIRVPFSADVYPGSQVWTLSE